MQFLCLPSSSSSLQGFGALNSTPWVINIGFEHAKMQSNLPFLLQPPLVATGTRCPWLSSPPAGTQLGDRSVLKGSRNSPQPVLGSFPGTRTLLCFVPGPMAPSPFPSVRMQAAALQTSHLGFKPNPGLLQGCSVLCRVGGFIRLIPAHCSLGLTLTPLRAAGPWGRVRICPEE